jgi:hypothetical protein
MQKAYSEGKLFFFNGFDIEEIVKLLRLAQVFRKAVLITYSRFLRLYSIIYFFPAILTNDPP